MEEPSIRQAKETDIPAVSQLQEQWCEEDITWGYYADTLEDLKGYIGSYFLVAECEGQLVGYIFGRVQRDPHLAALPSGQPCLEIVDLYVSPAYRSHGVGGMLVESILKSAREEGIRNYRLFSGTKDISRVVRFYEKHGFTIVNVEMIRKEGEEQA